MFLPKVSLLYQSFEDVSWLWLSFVSYLSDPRNSLIWILEWATTCVILIKHLASKSMELETACFGCS
jgi:hypothetical protein